MNEKKKLYSIKDSQSSITLKDVDTVGRTVCFIGNTLNYFDGVGDMLLSGVADKTFAERGAKSTGAVKIHHAMFHDLSRIAGKLTTTEQRTIDGKEVMYFESKLSKTTEGNDALTNYLAEIYNQHSIGYRELVSEFLTKEAHGNSKKWENALALCINPEEMDEAGYVNLVKEIQQYEVSTVAFGCNDQTPTLSIKSENKDAVMNDYLSRIDKLEKTLHSGTQSDEMMNIFEIQVIQLKQMIVDLFASSEFTKKEKQIITPKTLDFQKILNLI